MKGRGRIVAPLLLLLTIALVAVAGCTTQTKQFGSQPSTQSQQPTTMRVELVEQWLESLHSKPVTFAAEEDGCKNCHDGQTFTETGGGFVSRGLGTSPTVEASPSAGASASVETTRDWVVATDCRVCHTGPGVDIAKQGTIDIPGQTVKAGIGALCIACHDGWHGPGKNQAGGQRAPHESVQGDMVFGANVATLTAAATLDMTNPHQKVRNVCVGCHVTHDPVPANKESTATPDHVMLVKDTATCQGKDCHDNDPLTAAAKQDYDGNGTTDPLPDEVDGMMTKLKDAITTKAGGTFESKSGSIVFAKGAKPTAALYAAAYNYLFVKADKSRGVHNPRFTVSLLQASLSEVGAGTAGTGGSAGSTTTTSP